MRIEEMLAQLEVHPEVTLVRKVLNEGIEVEELEEIESELGCELVPGIRDFFLEHNGLTLEWYWTGNPKIEEAELADFDEEAHLPDLLEDYGPPVDGQLMVASLDEFMKPSYEEIDLMDPFGAAEAFFEIIQSSQETGGSDAFSFGDRIFETEKTFRSHLRYFDFFSRNTGAVLLYETGNSDPTVLYEPFRGGGYAPDKKVTLSQYLEYALSHFGLRWRRDLLFNGQQILDLEEGQLEGLDGVLGYCKQFHSS